MCSPFYELTIGRKRIHTQLCDKKKFTAKVLPRYIFTFYSLQQFHVSRPYLLSSFRYYGHAKFTSFTRRLKRWNFTRIPSGPFMGAYVNVNFVRGDSDRVRLIR